MTVVIIDPMIYLYALAYKYISIFTDAIDECHNVISLDELEELAKEENEEDV